MLKARLLPGLPPYGPLPEYFPSEWKRRASEGVVVEFTTPAGSWTGNFQPGTGGITFAGLLPNQRDFLVVASGDVWIVDPIERTAEQILPGLVAMFEVPDGWILNRQGLALVRLGAEGVRWHTRRLSWDGFTDLIVTSEAVTGQAWSAIDEEWRPFRVDLATGQSTGGGYSQGDNEGWERLL